MVIRAISVAVVAGAAFANIDIDAPAALRIAKGCKALEEPRHMPAVNSIVDSALLTQHLAIADSTFKGKITISIALTNPPAANVMDGANATAALDSIFRIVIAALRPTAVDSALAFRIVLQGGKPYKIKLDKPELCAPELMEMSKPEKVPMTRGRVTSSSPRMSMPPTPIIPAQLRGYTPRIRISPTGQVIDVQPNGKDDTIDAATRELWMSKRYNPATVDGVPVEVWFNGQKTELAGAAK